MNAKPSQAPKPLQALDTREAVQGGGETASATETELNTLTRSLLPGDALGQLRSPTNAPPSAGGAGRPIRALDLFCGAGGATKGLQLAGFHVTGIDINPQPRYCGDAFIQASALEPPVDLASFDFIWASPPCQAHTALKTMHNAKPHLDLIPQTRALLKSAGVPFCIENVVGAPLQNHFTLCGTQFGLGIDGAQLRRHRLFETNLGLAFPRRCKHKGRSIGVYGGGHGVSLHRHAKGERCHTAAQQRVAMGIAWMTVDELSQAIPPAYSEFIARAFLRTQKEGAGITPPQNPEV